MTEQEIRTDERERIAQFVEEQYIRQFVRPWREDLSAAIRAFSVKACGRCPGCVAGNLLPFDYKGLPMARCDTCGLEVNDATVEKWPSLDALHVHDPFSAVVAGFNITDGEEKGEDREQK